LYQEDEGRKVGYEHMDKIQKCRPMSAKEEALVGLSGLKVVHLRKTALMGDKQLPVALYSCSSGNYCVQEG
jgi:hypothetical protein